MKRIKLTRGKWAKVDDEDYQEVKKKKWHAIISANTYYANHSFRFNNKVKLIQMHRLILKAEPGQMIDHIDGDGLNNTKKNLRFVTNRENQRNSKVHREGQLLGTKKTASGRFEGQIKVNGKNIHLGTHDTVEEAHAAFIRADRHFNGHLYE